MTRYKKNFVTDCHIVDMSTLCRLLSPHHVTPRVITDTMIDCAAISCIPPSVCR